MTLASRVIGTWILGLVLLALLGVGVATRNQHGGAGGTLVALTAFTEAPLGNPWTPHAADAHAATGLRMLADAIAESSPSSPEQVETVRTLARALDVAPPGNVDADIAHDAFNRVGRVLSVMQTDRAPNLNNAAAALRAAADSVTTDKPLYEQRRAVVTFFVRARDLLRALAPG
jgi:hypothetical protein